MGLDVFKLVVRISLPASNFGGHTTLYVLVNGYFASNSPFANDRSTGGILSARTVFLICTVRTNC